MPLIEHAPAGNALITYQFIVPMAEIDDEETTKSGVSVRDMLMQRRFQEFFEEFTPDVALIEEPPVEGRHVDILTEKVMAIPNAVAPPVFAVDDDRPEQFRQRVR